ncbi:hypothetical protein os4_23220 [Comamonadaceae bacterium OS-4]|nr:hypothetical protein os4_23220 [Comamonadaceae bacterium OS-4]
MTVAELIAILAEKDPLSTVVVRDSGCETGFVEVRTIDSVTMRAYARKGMQFLESWDEERTPEEKTDVFAHPVHGVLLE